MGKNIFKQIFSLCSKLDIDSQMGLSNTFSCFEISLIILSLSIRVKKLSSVHELGDFNFREIFGPVRLSKSGTTLSQSEGQMLLDIMDDHGLEQMIHFPTPDIIGLLH